MPAADTTDDRTTGTNRSSTTDVSSTGTNGSSATDVSTAGTYYVTHGGS